MTGDIWRRVGAILKLGAVQKNSGCIFEIPVGRFGRMFRGLITALVVFAFVMAGANKITDAVHLETYQFLEQGFKTFGPVRASPPGVHCRPIALTSPPLLHPRSINPAALWISAGCSEYVEEALHVERGSAPSRLHSASTLLCLRLLYPIATRVLSR